jgi:hypothetical protein
MFWANKIEQIDIPLKDLPFSQHLNEQKMSLLRSWPRVYICHKLTKLQIEIFLNAILGGRDYFAGLRVTKGNKATVLLTLTLLQTPTLTLILTLS